MKVAEVLLVDDDRDMFTGLKALASAGRIGLTHAPTLQEGIKLNSSFSYDLVLLKDHLPDGVASEAIPSLRDVVGSPELIVYTRGGDPLELRK